MERGAVRIRGTQGLLLLTLCWLTPAAALAGSKAPRPSPQANATSWIRPGFAILHQDQTKDGRIVAYWLGEDPRGEDPRAFLPFATEELWFEFRTEGTTQGERVCFRPKGTLYFSDWTFDIFSPDGSAVVLLQDRFGPFHVVWTRRLQAYLRGKARPAETVGYERSERQAAAVHSFHGWLGPRTFAFRFACCGSEARGRHTIGSGRPPEVGRFQEATER